MTRSRRAACEAVSLEGGVTPSSVTVVGESLDGTTARIERVLSLGREPRLSRRAGAPDIAAIAGRMAADGALDRDGTIGSPRPIGSSDGTTFRPRRDVPLPGDAHAPHARGDDDGARPGHDGRRLPVRDAEGAGAQPPAARPAVHPPTRAGAVPAPPHAVDPGCTHLPCQHTRSA